MPVVWWLSVLTCTHANVSDRSEYRRVRAELGLAFVAPDTSPRGEGVADDPQAAEFGRGAGFYVDATQPRLSAHYRVWTYVTDELPALVASRFALDMGNQAITGHSMGGHGAQVAGLSLPGHYRSVSAFAPIVAPSPVSWERKALGGYLGSDRSSWRRYDAVGADRGWRTSPRTADRSGRGGLVPQ